MLYELVFMFINYINFIYPPLKKVEPKNQPLEKVEPKNQPLHLFSFKTPIKYNYLIRQY